jgi:hypothetical protein
MPRLAGAGDLVELVSLCGTCGAGGQGFVSGVNRYANRSITVTK